MQSVLVYSRFFARAILSGFASDFQHGQTNVSTSKAFEHAKELKLTTAIAGISKSNPLVSNQISRKWSFGDDACFISNNIHADVIGVFDGVGGWINYGIDPSLFPRTLMLNCQRIVNSNLFEPDKPLNLIESGYQEVLQNKVPLLGSCTACIISLYRREKTLHTANLGDSGFMLIREGEVIHRSEEQQHYFNAPFQLGIAPSKLQGLVHSDLPETASESTFGVQKGDIILLATDGLFDNLSEDMILGHVSKMKGHNQESIQKTAECLVHKARELSLDPHYMSPFAENANQHGFSIEGGKPDDITVLLGCITLNDIISEVDVFT